MKDAARKRLIEDVASCVIAHADELTRLDQAIGDGDHGLNMKRGFDAILAEADSLARKPLPEALKSIGMELVMKVGGASGPLYGTLAMSLGKELGPNPGAADFAKGFAAAVEAVKARGKSEPGQKTMLDVLVPVQTALAQGGPDILDRLPGVAEDAARATVAMKAIRGRASFLGDRSVGHMDPGARSTALIVAATCQALKGVR